MTTEWLQWYYLIYLLPAGAAVLVLLLSSMGGHRGGHARAPRDGLRGHGPRGSAHVRTPAPHATHGHAGSHGPAAHHGHGHAHGSHGAHRVTSHGPTVGRQLLGFFGLGRAPITVVVGCLMIGWGLFGFAATELLRPVLRLPALFAGPAMFAATVGALVSAKLFGELAARLMPKDETCSIPREGLLGLTGKVVYPISETGGRVHVFDGFHTLHVERARVALGAASIEKGTDVIVTSMDPERGVLIVEPLGFSMEKKR